MSTLNERAVCNLLMSVEQEEGGRKMRKDGNDVGWVGGLGCRLVVGLSARLEGAPGGGGSCATWKMWRMCGCDGFVGVAIAGGEMKVECREARMRTFAEIAAEAFAKSSLETGGRWESWGKAVLGGVAGIECGGSWICWSRRTTS